ncbi:MAG: glutamate synthase subunit alpha, partial [Actinobacteria bacterium]|nr:glutamate synthase subunit alpha [Actinomycetota bacterium]
TCPTGIATQRPELRAKFAGTPERVAAYFLSVAEEVRGILASLGLRSLEEAVGRTDLVQPRETGHRRADALHAPLPDTRGAGPRRFVSSEPVQRPASPLGNRLVEDGLGAIRDGGFRELAYRIGNGDRAVGAGLSGEIARAFGSQPPPGRIRAHFRGQAGQSFAAFLVSGVELRLVGEANDYVGKGMAGGRIVIRPPENDQGDPVLLGNTVLYGATGGELFCAGRAGERFAVRNSGAVAVVEGVGDHACEYMTAGTVVVLGPVGRNLGAGMSGGACFVQDPEGGLAGRVNPDLVLTRRPSGEELDVLRGLLERHLDLTGSARAFTLLAGDESLSEEFRLVVPRDAGAAAPLGPGLAAPREGAPVGVPSAGR